MADCDKMMARELYLKSVGHTRPPVGNPDWRVFAMLRKFVLNHDTQEAVALAAGLRAAPFVDFNPAHLVASIAVDVYKEPLQPYRQVEGIRSLTSGSPYSKGYLFM